MARATLDAEIAIARSLCRALGLGEVEPHLLKAAHHTTLLLHPHALVARIQSGDPLDEARVRAAREIAVARHLASRNAPALPPAAGALAGPHEVGAAVVTLWPYLPDLRAAEEADAPQAAPALDAVHQALRDHAGDLPPYTSMLDRCWAVLAEGRMSHELARSDRDLLRAQFRRLRAEVARAPASWVPLHGDPHLGNLLVRGEDVLWTDFEDACRGPREHDIAVLPEAVWGAFAGIDRALVARFADLRSVCVATWCWVVPSRSPEMREAACYHLDRVRRLAA